MKKDLQSFLYFIPRKQLGRIILELVRRDFDWNYPYDSISSDIEILDQILKYFNQVANDIDVEFFYKLYELNSRVIDNLDPEQTSVNFVEELQLPIAHNYLVEYTLHVSKTETEFYETKWASYDENYVFDAMREARDNGNWDYHDGELVDTDSRNYEVFDETFEKVERIDENLKKNESSIIESMDKETLLYLKSIIDKRLNVL